MKKKTKFQPKKRVDGLKHEMMYKKLVDHMNEAVWVGDDNERTVYANPKFCELMGYTMEEMLNKESYDFWDEESARTVRYVNEHKRAKGISSSYEGNLLTKKGERIPVLLSGTPLPWGGTIGIMTDLRELKEKERKERISENIIRNSYEAIVILDKNKNVKLWNQGAHKIFGYEEKEVLGKSIDIVVPIDESEGSDRIMAEVEEKGLVRGIDVRRVTKMGEFVDVTVTVSKVEDEKGGFIGYLVNYVDVTDKKRASDELQKRFETIQDAYKELGIQKRQIDYMNDIGNVAVSEASLATLENLMVSSISLLTKADAAVLRVYDEEHDSLKLKSCIGVSSNWWSKDKIPFRNGIAAEAFRRRRALIVDNVTMNMKYRGAKLLKEHKFKTLIVTPLFINDKFLGSLNIYAVNPEKFRFIETDFLENFGRQCAMALYVKMNASK